MGNKSLIIVGLLGGLTGVIAASIGEGDKVALPDAESPIPDVEVSISEQPTPSTTKANNQVGATDDLLDAVQNAHQRLNDGEQGGGASRLSASFEKELKAQKSYRPILRDYFNRVGQGSLVTQGRLTDAGKAIIDYAATVTDHGLPAKNYPVETVRNLLDKLVPGGATTSSARSLNPTHKTLQGLLLAPEFDRAKTLEALEQIQPRPTVADVTEVESNLKQTTLAKPVSKQEMAAELATARLLMTLVLDFKIFRRAGPFRPLTNKSEAFALYKSRPKKAVAAMINISLAEEPAKAITQLEPTRPEYKALVKLHRTYLGYAKKKCHRRLNPEMRLQVGRKGAEVRALQERLACEGLYKGPIHGSFDEAVKTAVVTYQKHHSLNDEGFVKKGTLTSMNVSLAQRAKQMALVLQRFRESPAENLGETYIRVNIPSFELQVIRNNKVIRAHDVIVGTNRLDDNKLKLVQGHLNRTRLFTTELYEIVVNPDWILPERVEKGEVRTKLANDPNYLKKNNIRRITLPSGKSAMVQGRGELNVLGKVKFHLRESNAIFLHDTNDRSLFRHSKRDLSHGCIRVKHAERFAKWLLAEDGWDKGEVKRTFKAEKTQRGMKLKKPFPLVTEYMTVSVSAEGLPIFYRDVYGYDQDYFKGRLPATTEVRWGDPQLRPGWVPRVPKEIVDGWRRAGKPAPRDYKPPPT